MSRNLTELAWFKSSYSGSSNNECVEVAVEPRTIHVRDSKNRQGPALAFSAEAWAAFVGFASER